MDWHLQSSMISKLRAKWHFTAPRDQEEAKSSIEKVRCGSQTRRRQDLNDEEQERSHDTRACRIKRVWRSPEVGDVAGGVDE